MARRKKKTSEEGTAALEGGEDQQLDTEGEDPQAEGGEELPKEEVAPAGEQDAPAKEESKPEPSKEKPTTAQVKTGKAKLPTRYAKFGG